MPTACLRKKHCRRNTGVGEGEEAAAKSSPDGGGPHRPAKSSGFMLRSV